MIKIEVPNPANPRSTITVWCETEQDLRAVFRVVSQLQAPTPQSPERQERKGEVTPPELHTPPDAFDEVLDGNNAEVRKDVMIEEILSLGRPVTPKEILDLLRARQERGGFRMMSGGDINQKVRYVLTRRYGDHFEPLGDGRWWVAGVELPEDDQTALITEAN